MATLIRDFRDLPEVTAPVLRRKPPVLSFPYQDHERLDEADEFLAFIRELRRNSLAKLPRSPRQSEMSDLLLDTDTVWILFKPTHAL